MNGKEEVPDELLAVVDMTIVFIIDGEEEEEEGVFNIINNEEKWLVVEDVQTHHERR